MLDLRRLRLLRELQRARHDRRGRRRAPVHALGRLPAARDARARGRRAAARARRARRAADRPGARARRARRRAARARRARRGRPRRGGRHRQRAAGASPASSRWRCASRCRRWRRCAATRRGCAASSSRPSPSRRCPALALGDVDLVLGDEWQHQPLARCPPALERHELLHDPVHARPARPPPVPPGARRTRCRSPSSPARPWTTGHAGMGWEEMIQRTCRELGGFEPDIRHRTNDATVSLALVAARARRRRCCRSSPCPSALPGVAVRHIAEGPVSRTIFAVTRAADAARPSTQALLAAVRARPRRWPRRGGASARYAGRSQTGTRCA